MKYIKIVIIAVLLIGCSSPQKQEQKFILADQDTYVNSMNLKADYSKSEFILISNFINGDNKTITRGLLNFDFAVLPKNIKIDSAFIYLSSPYDDLKKSSGNNAFKIKQISEEWDESDVNWENLPKSIESTEVVLPKTSIEFQDYEKINVTQMVQNMFSTGDFFGFLLKMEEEDLDYKVQFLASSDNKDDKLKPALQVFYSQKD